MMNINLKFRPQHIHPQDLDGLLNLVRILNDGRGYSFGYYNLLRLLSESYDDGGQPDSGGPSRSQRDTIGWLEAWDFSQSLIAANKELFQLTSNSITGDRSFGSGVGAVAYVKGEQELSEAHSALREAATDLTTPQISVASKDIPLGAANAPLALHTMPSKQFNFADAANAITYDAPANVVALRPPGPQLSPYKTAAGF